MRVPEHFRPGDPHDAWEVIRRHPLGTLVTARPGEAPLGSPLPFLARPDDGPCGAVIGHIARDNPQLEALASAESSALVIFQGPRAYVSGAYYEDQPAVPTVNHVTVHVAGAPRVLEADATLAVLEKTVAHFEALAGSSWRLDSAHPDVRRMAEHVSAFRVELHRIDASFKLSQNVDDPIRAVIATRLRADGHHDIVAAMREHARVGA